MDTPLDGLTPSTPAWRRIVALVRGAAGVQGRGMDTLVRRSAKLGEELGEVQDAWLSVTSRGNRKGKTWDDVREEAADALIVALDLALTFMPEEEAVRCTPLEQDGTRLMGHVGRAASAQGRLLCQAELAEDGIPLDARALGKACSAAVKATLAACILCMGMEDKAGEGGTGTLEGLLIIVEAKVGKWVRNTEQGTDSISLPDA